MVKTARFAVQMLLHLSEKRPNFCSDFKLTLNVVYLLTVLSDHGDNKVDYYGTHIQQESCDLWVIIVRTLAAAFWINWRF